MVSEDERAVSLFVRFCGVGSSVSFAATHSNAMVRILTAIRGTITYVGEEGSSFRGNSGDLAPAARKKLLQLRKQQWGELKDAAREQFYWAHPGSPRSQSWPIEAEAAGAGAASGITATAAAAATTTEATAKGIPKGGRGSDGKVLPPPPTFLLALLSVETVDHLQLREQERRISRRADGGWNELRVNP